MREEGVVYVGRGRAASYAVAAMHHLMALGRATFKARGRNISTAVSAEEILKRRLGDSLVVEKVEIGEERLERDGRQRTVSTMEITISIRKAAQNTRHAKDEAKPAAKSRGK